MKINHAFVGSMALLVSQPALAGRPVGAPVGVPAFVDGTGLLAIAAAGLALGVWIIRRNRDK